MGSKYRIVFDHYDIGTHDWRNCTFHPQDDDTLLVQHENGEVEYVDLTRVYNLYITKEDLHD